MPELNPTGALRDPEDKRDILFSSLVPATMAVDLPRKFSLRNKVWFKAFAQKYGSCVGCSGRYLMQYLRGELYGDKTLLSERFIYGRAKELDGQPSEEGTWPRICLMGMFGNGAAKLTQWNNNNTPTHAEFIKSPPDDIRESAILNILGGGAVRVTSFEEMKRAIFMGSPVMVTLQVFETYDDIEDDGQIKPSDGSGARGYHENIAIGWDDDTGEIELMNSWGQSWGDDGFGFMPLNYSPYSNFPLMDMWAISQLVSAAVTSGAPIELGYPVDTANPYVTQSFGARPEYYAKYGMSGHNGVDFRTIGTSRYILAAADGEIISCNPSDGGYGKSIRIKHPWGMSIYAHNSQFLVSPLDNYGNATKVTRGQRIAVAGTTGDSSAEHCHFGIRINGVKNPGFLDWVDPSPYFKEKSMTKRFRIKQGPAMGILILEGFSGTGLFESNWAEYQTLLKISNDMASAPLIEVPAGKFFRIDDHGKAGILVIDGFSATVIFEDNFEDYKKLLEISGMTMSSPLVLVP